MTRHSNKGQSLERTAVLPATNPIQQRKWTSDAARQWTGIGKDRRFASVDVADRNEKKEHSNLSPQFAGSCEESTLFFRLRSLCGYDHIPRNRVDLRNSSRDPKRLRLMPHPFFVNQHLNRLSNVAIRQDCSLRGWAHSNSCSSRLGIPHSPVSVAVWGF